MKQRKNLEGYKCNEKDFKTAMINMKETKAYRNSVDEITKEKMYAPSEELYKLMSE